MSREYYDFLRGKVNVAPESGFVVLCEEVSSVLKPHQRDGVRYLREAEMEMRSPTLFDLVDCEVKVL